MTIPICMIIILVMIILAIVFVFIYRDYTNRNKAIKKCTDRITYLMYVKNYLEKPHYSYTFDELFRLNQLLYSKNVYFTTTILSENYELQKVNHNLETIKLHKLFLIELVKLLLDKTIEERSKLITK